MPYRAQRRYLPGTNVLEPPGFLMLSYGRGSPVVGLVAHLVYGPLAGGLATLPLTGHAASPGLRFEPRASDGVPVNFCCRA